MQRSYATNMAEVTVYMSWMSINKVVVPVLHRRREDVTSRQQLVPLMIVRYAVGCVRNVPVRIVRCTAEEGLALTKNCIERGIQMTFDENTELIQLDCVLDLSAEGIVFCALSEVYPWIIRGANSIDGRVEVVKKSPSINELSSVRRDDLKTKLLPEESKDKQDIVLRKALKEDIQQRITDLTCDNEDNRMLRENKVFKKIKVASVETENSEKKPEEQNSEMTNRLKQGNDGKSAIIKKTIFGVQMCCLLNNGSYFILLEQLHKSFFSHISFPKLKHIAEILLKSVAVISPEKLEKISTSCFRGIQHGEVVPVGEVKRFLVNTKSILKRSEMRKARCDAKDLHEATSGKAVNQNVMKLPSTNIVNILIINYRILPGLHLNIDRSLRVAPGKTGSALHCGKTAMTSADKSTDLVPVIQNATETPPNVATDTYLADTSDSNDVTRTLNPDKRYDHRKAARSHVTQESTREDNKESHQVTVYGNETKDKQCTTGVYYFRMKKRRLSEIIDKIKSKKKSAQTYPI